MSLTFSKAGTIYTGEERKYPNADCELIQGCLESSCKLFYAKIWLS